jgi:arylsulfatase A-like enzyme
VNPRPNIILFNPDQWRGDFMGHLGHRAARTPTLDRLVASDAISFRNAFCQNPVCTPSRCSFMTGWYPHVRGHRSMHHMLAPDEPCLLKVLKDNGYFVWWAGKNDLISAERSLSDYVDVKYNPPGALRPDAHTLPREQGDYSFYVGKLPGHDGTSVYRDFDWANVQGACEMIRTHDSSQPFCINLSLLYPHAPYAVEEPYYSAIDRALVDDAVPEPTDLANRPLQLRLMLEACGLRHKSPAFWRELRATYLAMCMRVDAQLAMLIATLQQTGQYDNTAIFVFSDHGDFTGDFGCVEKAQTTLYDCLTRVPLIVKPPTSRAILPGVREQLAELVDLSATVYDLAGIDPGYTHFGRSVAPLFSNPTHPHRDVVFCEAGRNQNEPHAAEPAIAPSSHYYPRVNIENTHWPAQGRATMCRTARYKYIRRAYETDELYDLELDPREQHNRIADPSLATVLAELKEHLLTWLQTTADVVPHHRDTREVRPRWIFTTE